MCPLCPSWGQGSPPDTVGEQTLGSQCCQEKETELKQTGGRLDEGHSGSSAAGGLAGGLGMESLELGKHRGLMQGLLLGLTLAPALETQVGQRGPAWAAPSPPVSRASAGFSSAAVGLTQLPWAPQRRRPGKWDTSGWPGGGGCTSDPTLTCPPSHPSLFYCLVGTQSPE